MSPKAEVSGLVSRAVDISILASVSEWRVSVSVSSQVDWWMPQSWSWNWGSWYQSQTVRPPAHLWTMHQVSCK